MFACGRSAGLSAGRSAPCARRRNSEVAREIELFMFGEHYVRMRARLAHVLAPKIIKKRNLKTIVTSHGDTNVCSSSVCRYYVFFPSHLYVTVKIFATFTRLFGCKLHSHIVTRRLLARELARERVCSQRNTDATHLNLVRM